MFKSHPSATRRLRRSHLKPHQPSLRIEPKRRVSKSVSHQKSSFSTQSTSSPQPSKSNPQPLSQTVLPIKVTNSLTGQLEPLTIRHSLPSLPSTFTSKHLHTGYNNALTWYVCGPTVYDASHIGHARTYTNFDMMRRIISHYFNIPLVFAMGVTDIDDKIITRSKERKMHWLTLARHFEHEFNADLQRLNILPPDYSLRVSEFIPDIVDYISQLQARNLTYLTSDGVYFDVVQFTQNKHLYAKLRYSSLEDAAQQVQKALIANDPSLFEDDSTPPTNTNATPNTSSGTSQSPTNPCNPGSNHTVSQTPSPTSQPATSPSSEPSQPSAMSYQPTVVGNRAKRHSADFCLWKFQKHDYEPSFPSPFGAGRPGWHIECSAMTASALGVGIDIHSGGVDLRFPHHCNEIAQAEGCLGWGRGHLEKYSRGNSENANNDQNHTNSPDNSLDVSQNWTSTWIHTGHLNIQGLKMSKSLKNFITIQQLFLDGYDADEFRMLCATSPYSATLDYTPLRLQQCRQELKNVLNFSELIQRTLKQSKLHQVQQYNAHTSRHQIDLNLNGKFIIKGDDSKQTFDSLADVDFATSAVQNSTPSSSTSSQQPTHNVEGIHYHQSSQIRPQQLEYDLEQSLMNVKSAIHGYLATDFNTQATVSSISALISTASRYIGDKQARDEPPSSLLLTQVSTYIYQIYAMLGFQFAGAVGGDWNALASGISSNAATNSSNVQSFSTQLADDGVPVYLHELANQRFLLKQAAVDGSKLIKQLHKLNPFIIPANSDTTHLSPPQTDQILLDKATYDNLIATLKNQTQNVMGTCDTIRDLIFVQAGHTLKDTASARINGNKPAAPYFIRPLDKFEQGKQ